MRALCWQAPLKVGVETVPDPAIINPHDIILKVKATTICGSDLHLYDGYVPTMEPGDIIGHEFMGEVVEIGHEVKSLKAGDRVVVPSVIACGYCFFCRRKLWSLCDNTNPNAWMMEKIYGHSSLAIFGYSHLFGGYSGSFAEYIRVPFADVGALKLPDSVRDEQALFLSDAFPTGYMAADNCDIQPGDVVAVWGCGAVGLFAICTAYMLGAERVIAIDRFPERLQLAKDYCNAEILDYSKVNVVEALRELTGGMGPDACIDAVGMEAQGTTPDAIYDKVKQTLRLETDRIHVVRDAIQSCRKGGTFSIVGVYAGFLDKFPLGAAFNKGLNFKMGQMHAHRYLRPMLERVERGEIDPSFVVTHRMPLSDAPRGFEMFKHKQDNCVRIVFTP